MPILRSLTASPPAGADIDVVRSHRRHASGRHAESGGDPQPGATRTGAMTGGRESSRICTPPSREARTVTTMHFATDPVPVLPTALAPARPRLLERFLRWIDEGLADLDSDD
jgi:hypothetical protein